MPVGKQQFKKLINLAPGCNGELVNVQVNVFVRGSAAITAA